MNIYEPLAVSRDQCDLKSIASRLAEFFLPGAVPISPPIYHHSARLMLRQKSVLVEFCLHADELGDDQYGSLLEEMARLEARRKEEHDPTLQEIAICIGAFGFSQNFLTRIPHDLIRVMLFEWSFLRSDKEEALLVRQVRRGNALEHGDGGGNLERLKHSLFAHTKAPQDLSTPELVAFSRFGMELRSRKKTA